MTTLNKPGRPVDYHVTVWRYVIGPEYEDRLSGWGIFLVDSEGMMSVVSDYGNYAYLWSSIGDRDFREFLSDCDEWYLTSKLAPQRSYDGAATERRIKDEIARKRRNGSISRARARLRWDCLLRADLGSELGFSDWVRDDDDTVRHHHHCSGDGRRRDEQPMAAHELAVYTHSPQIQMFCRRLWPRFVARLQAQLKEETAGVA